jgi:hypothetical protein
MFSYTAPRGAQQVQFILKLAVEGQLKIAAISGAGTKRLH